MTDAQTDGTDGRKHRINLSVMTHMVLTDAFGIPEAFGPPHQHSLSPPSFYLSVLNCQVCVTIFSSSFGLKNSPIQRKDKLYTIQKRQVEKIATLFVEKTFDHENARPLGIYTMVTLVGIAIDFL